MTELVYPRDYSLTGRDTHYAEEHHLVDLGPGEEVEHLSHELVVARSLTWVPPEARRDRSSSPRTDSR